MMSLVRELRTGGRRMGFVPTMGALHEGHLSLMTHAREMCNILIISIFVNPSQFGPEEDLDRYPRDLARDSELAFGRGVDFIFTPTAAEMYPEGFSTHVEVTDLSKRLEGVSRPGHFRGVITVVSKLLNIVRPHFVFFGQKDAQQVLVCKRMIRDLSIDTEVIVCPTVREEDGLALSSRNTYLSSEQRKAAPVLCRALEHCRSLYQDGQRDAAKLVSAMRSVIEAEPLAIVDYIAITDTTKLEPLDVIAEDVTTLVSMAVRFGTTRLIDNIVLNGEL